MTTLAGLKAIVTGSTSGIGKAIAERLAREGANIVINGFGDAEAIEADRAALEQNHGIQAIYSDADMTKPDAIRAMMNETYERFGAIDILVNNAGIQHTDRIENFPDEKWDAIIAINLSSAFYTIKSAIPHMREKNFGRIVNIASAHGLVASPEKAAYVTAKHGIIGLTRVVALENATDNITVNAVCPGWVETPLVKQQIEARAEKNGTSYQEEAEKLVGEKQPNKRFQTPESIADAVMYFVKPDNQYNTGTVLTVDGGWTST